MPEPAYWTAADQAELGLLVAELVDVHALHTKLCPVCTFDGTAFCRPLRDAITAVIEWREKRLRYCKAAGLRASQDLTDWAA